MTKNLGLPGANTFFFLFLSKQKHMHENLLGYTILTFKGFFLLFTTQNNTNFVIKYKYKKLLLKRGKQNGKKTRTEY